MLYLGNINSGFKINLKSCIMLSILTLSVISYAVTADSNTNNQNTAKLSVTLELESIMADPDWMGNSPSYPRWSLDGKQIYFDQKAVGHQHENTMRINTSDLQTSLVKKDGMLASASASAKLNPSRTHGVFVFQKNIYLIELASNQIHPITANSAGHLNAFFIDDKTLSYQIGYGLYTYHLETGLERKVAEFYKSKDPDVKKEKNYLQQSQPRLLKTIEMKQQENAFQKERETSLELQSFKKWYLGDGIEIKTFRLSPNGRYLVLGTIKSDLTGAADHMPEFVTEDGYVNDRKVRPLVGTSKPVNETFYVFDIKKQIKKRVDLSKLPGINDDPLSDLRKKAAKKIGYKYQEQSGPRAVYAYNWSENQGVEWTEDSSKAAIMLFSYDNKSRWIVSFEIKKSQLKTAHWLTDEAWVNDWTFNQFGWLPDNQTLYYLSEESGYSQIYIKKGKRKSARLTNGDFEVDEITVTRDGKQMFYRANKKHPGIHEVYALDISKRSSRPVTSMGGNNEYVLSPDETTMIITHSTTTQMPELYLQSIADGSNSKQITDTMSDAFKSVQWQSPEIIAVPSTNTDKPIYSRLYRASQKTDLKLEQETTDKLKNPAVIFVHGAGYLQNSHQGWSGYFREFMFHNYLTNKGYVVLDMDYRASKGYGRDWRTAIYRNMGTPELEDLKDGTKWLVENMNVDPNKIGIYGGSYGGFMTFMALFKEPDLFAAGAALRPVTDWSHYNHGYTSNILNTPQVDPEAFERSSPIEFAEGLKNPLLICHGMVDDNVFFKDSVRLVQKLIELKKTKYFETAIYPVEPHGFKEASSWLDEYTRIDRLFEENLR